MSVLADALSSSGATVETADVGGDGGAAGAGSSAIAAPDVAATSQSTGEEPQAAQAATAAPPATTTTTAQTLDEDGLPDNHPVPRKALIDERRKRQEMDRQFAELQRQHAELQGRLTAYSQFAPQPSPAAQPEPKLDFYGNPEGFVEGKVTAVDGRLTSVETQLSGELRKQRLDMSEMMVRSQHSDFDEVSGAFVEATKMYPWLQQAFRESPHPAQFAYEQGKTLLEVKKYGGNLDEMRKRMKEEAKAELEAERTAAEVEAKKQASIDAANKVSTSTAGARGTGASTKAASKMRENPLKDALA